MFSGLSLVRDALWQNEQLPFFPCCVLLRTCTLLCFCMTTFVEKAIHVFLNWMIAAEMSRTVPLKWNVTLFFLTYPKACRITLFMSLSKHEYLKGSCFNFPRMQAINHIPSRDCPRGLMDKASDFGSENGGSGSLRRGRFLFRCWTN